MCREICYSKKYYLAKPWLKVLEKNRVRINQLDSQIILSTFRHFINLYMFRAYLGLSSGRTTVCIQQLVLIILFRWLSDVLVGLEQYTYRCTS